MGSARRGRLRRASRLRDRAIALAKRPRADWPTLLAAALETPELAEVFTGPRREQDPQLVAGIVLVLGVAAPEYLEQLAEKGSEWPDDEWPGTLENLRRAGRVLAAGDRHRLRLEHTAWVTKRPTRLPRVLGEQVMASIESFG